MGRACSPRVSVCGADYRVGKPIVHLTASLSLSGGGSAMPQWVQSSSGTDSGAMHTEGAVSEEAR
eukprot:7324137-Prorocentrum_lima.AAC.1